MAIDTMNYFGVAKFGELVVIAEPQMKMLSKDLALNLAAWLVALADPDQEEFPKVLAAVKGT